MFKRFKQKSSVEPSLPSPQAGPARYEGRPLLIILENYVLDCIGSLPQDKQGEIQQVVHRVFGGGSDWKSTVRQQLQLGDGIDDSFRAMWTQNQAIAADKGVELHDVQFAKMVVDQNFTDLIA